jgi:peptidoglycan/xylan/chitin deacetylase (PgdA/CDA1 family)
MLSTIPILLYHSIAPFELSGVWIPKRRFEEQIRWLFRNKFRCIKLQEIFTNDPFPKSVAITFDDGYDNFYEGGLPVLLKYGFTATIFLVSYYAGKPNTWDAGVTRRTHMGWDKLRELSKLGFEISSHTHTHPDLTRLSRKEIRRELEFSKKIIEDKIGKPVEFLSYPFGRYSKLARDCAKDLGYTACFSSNPLTRDRWAMGRMSVYVIDTMKEYKVKLHPESKSLYKLESIKTTAINFVARGTPIWKSLIGRGGRVISGIDIDS